MKRQHQRLVTLLVLLTFAVTGCHPTQPFYLHEDGDLSHYLDAATEVEHPDINSATLAEVAQARAPLTLSESEFSNFRDLTLEDCVSIALENSKVIRNLGSLTQFTIADGLVGRTATGLTVYDPAIFESDPQFGVEAALSAFDAQFTTNVFLNTTDRPQNFGLTFFASQSAEGQFEAALSKRTATGTTFTVRNQTLYDDRNIDPPQRPLYSDWLTIFEAEATQPLLRGRGTQVNRVPVVLARIRTDISIADFEISVRNMMLDLENSYWDLHFAYRFLETAKTGRDSALVTWKNTYVLLQGGKGTAQQEAQAREQYFFFRSQMETALRDLFTAETRLRWLMGLAATDGELIRPIDRPTLARVDFEWNEVHAESLVRYPELRRQRWLVKQRETEMIAARNQLLPQLDIVATYRWLGRGDQLITADRRGLNFPDEGSTAFDELTEGRFQEARVGLQFTPPAIGARRELAGVRNAQLNLARSHARLEDMELNVSHLLTTAIQNLDFNYRVSQTHFNRWVAAEKEVEALKALYEGGQATVDLVLDGQRRRAQAQAEFYRSIIEYNKAIANVHFRKGSLLEYNSVQLAEGPWPKKAYWDALGHARERDASYYLDYGWTRPKVISRGPVPQVAEPGTFQQWPTEAGDVEQIPTPAGTPMDIPMEATDYIGPDVMPSQSGIMESPSITLKDDAPPELLRRPDNSDFDWSALGLDTGLPKQSRGVQPAGHWQGQ
jgi:outer membrane protein TolC